MKPEFSEYTFIRFLIKSIVSYFFPVNTPNNFHSLENYNFYVMLKLKAKTLSS